MEELKFLEIIKSTLSDSHYIGDDCANLKEVGMFMTQDSLVEGVHFDLSTTTPYQLGVKTVAVNISDLAAAIATPVYISIGLSMPRNISEDFVREFYRGVDFACKKYNVVVTGGDITGADKVYISAAALGKRRHGIDTSRSFAAAGNFVISTGNYGTSAAGLFALKNNLKVSDEIINAHLMPEARLYEAFDVGYHVENNIAVTDTSDGLADALFKIAEASKVKIKVNFDELPVLPEVKELAKNNNVDLKDWVLWGGEDFELLCCVPYYYFAILSSKGFKYVGYVEESTDKPCVVVNDGEKETVIDKNLFDTKGYKHFGG
ncbi:MAG: thiamine-phosphate kinase [Candidatus Gastranaerophilales bacterium]|nr:thiamine-phosphate kinase [Candidatus Gastranaerophilales bacterium]